MGSSINVNRFIVGKGSARVLVLYSYQEHGRAILVSFGQNIFSSAILSWKNRTDSALVRVVQPIAPMRLEKQKLSVKRLRSQSNSAYFGLLIPLFSYDVPCTAPVPATVAPEDSVKVREASGGSLLLLKL